MAARGEDTGPVLDESDGDDLLGAVAGRLGFRDRIRRSSGLNLAWRLGVGLVGGLVLAAGIVMIPYPGPGWLVVFAGLAILATEFAWAERVLRVVKKRYDAWTAWLGRQRPATKAAVWLATALVVITTLWLLGVYALIGGWFGVDRTWLRSPIL
ncbi:MAG TPA: TIGR02611 family protein [Pseudonocardiaceae bacterium]